LGNADQDKVIQLEKLNKKILFVKEGSTDKRICFIGVGQKLKLELEMIDL
jgi:hypothetical protein